MCYTVDVIWTYGPQFKWFLSFHAFKKQNLFDELVPQFLQILNKIRMQIQLPKWNSKMLLMLGISENSHGKMTTLDWTTPQDTGVF